MAGQLHAETLHRLSPGNSPTSAQRPNCRQYEVEKIVQQDPLSFKIPLNQVLDRSESPGDHMTDANETSFIGRSDSNTDHSETISTITSNDKDILDRCVVPTSGQIDTLPLGKLIEKPQDPSSDFSHTFKMTAPRSCGSREVADQKPERSQHAHRPHATTHEPATPCIDKVGPDAMIPLGLIKEKDTESIATIHQYEQSESSPLLYSSRFPYPSTHSEFVNGSRDHKKSNTTHSDQDVNGCNLLVDGPVDGNGILHTGPVTASRVARNAALDIVISPLDLSPPEITASKLTDKLTSTKNRPLKVKKRRIVYAQLARLDNPINITDATRNGPTNEAKIVPVSQEVVRPPRRGLLEDSLKKHLANVRDSSTAICPLQEAMAGTVSSPIPKQSVLYCPSLRETNARGVDLTAENLFDFTTSKGTPSASVPRTMSYQRKQADQPRIRQTLHRVSDQYGEVRVSKPIASNLRRLPQPSTVGKDSCDVLQAQIEMQDMMSKFTDRHAESLQKKQLELEAALLSNVGVTEQLQQSRAERAKLQSEFDKWKTTLSRYKKFLNGLNNDLASLRGTRTELDTALIMNKELRDNLEQQAGVVLSLSKVKAEALLQCRNLVKINARLESNLNEMAGQLSEEKDRNAFIQRQVDKQVDDNKISSSLTKLNDLVDTKLTAILESVGDQQRDDEISKRIKEGVDITEGLGSTAQAAVGQIEELKVLIETGLEANKIASDHINAMPVLAKEIIGSIKEMKMEVQSDKHLQARNTLVQETITRLRDSLKDGEIQIGKLDFQVNELRARETCFQAQVDHLQGVNKTIETKNASLVATKSTSEEEINCGKQRLLHEIEEMKTENIAQTSKIQDLSSQVHVLAQEKEEMQRSMMHTRDQLDAHRTREMSWEPLRRELLDKHQCDIQQLRQQTTKQADGIRAKHIGRLSQEVKQRELAEHKLIAMAAEIESIKSESAMLKEQAKLVPTLQTWQLSNAEMNAKSKLINELEAALAAESCDNDTLQQSLSELQTSQQDPVPMYTEPRREVSAGKLPGPHEIEEKTIDQDATGDLRPTDDTEKHGQQRLRASGKEMQNPVIGLRSELDGNDAHDDRGSQLVREDQSDNSSANKVFTQQGPSYEGQQPRKQRKRIERSQLAVSRTPVTVQSDNSCQQVIEVAASENDVSDGQNSEEDMLDNRRPRAKSSAVPGFDGNAVIAQVLDDTGVRMRHDTNDAQPEQSETPETDAAVDDVLKLRFYETQTHVISSSLSPSRSMYAACEGELYEETQDYISQMTGRRSTGYSQMETQSQEAIHWPRDGFNSTMRSTQDQDMSPPPRRPSALSQGKKRDPIPIPLHEPLSGKKVSTSDQQTNMKQASQIGSSPSSINAVSQTKSTIKTYTHKQRMAAPKDSQDIYDLEISPVPLGQKRPLSHLTKMSSGIMKKPRLNTTVAEESRASSNQHHPSSLDSQQSTANILSLPLRAAAAGMRSSAGSSRTTRKSSRMSSSSKIEERFKQN